MTEKQLSYAYSDESPTLSSSDNHLVVAVVVALKAGDKNLARIPKRIREKIVRKKLKRLSELKFSNSDENTRIRMLEMLASEEIEIFSLVVDKGKRQISDSPVNNGIVLGNAIVMVLKERGRISLTPDKKFVKAQDTACYVNTAERIVSEKVLKGFLIVKEPADSQKEPLVQLADFAAGAISCKYNR